MKPFLRFPELLLPLSIFAILLFTGNSTINFQMHGSYFVFARTPLGCNLFFVSIIVFLVCTWLMHILCGRYQYWPKIWRWAHVVFTLLCVLMMAKILSSTLFDGDGRFVSFSPAALDKFQLLN